MRSLPGRAGSPVHLGCLPNSPPSNFGQHVLPNVADEHIVPLLAEPLLATLRPNPTPVMGGTVSCTGTDYCDLALADTKSSALRVVQQIDRSGTARRPISIHWSGCPAACGNHHRADIGLQGNRARVAGKVIETFHVFVGGQIGPNARPGERVLEDVPATDVERVVAMLVAAQNRGVDLVAAGRAIAAGTDPLAAIGQPASSEVA